MEVPSDSPLPDVIVQLPDQIEGGPSDSPLPDVIVQLPDQIEGGPSDSPLPDVIVQLPDQIKGGPSDSPLPDVIVQLPDQIEGGPSDARLRDGIVEVTKRIKEKVDNLPPKHSWHYIRKVQDDLREVNEKAYDPVVVAIGPYHRGKAQLRKMEDLKLCCFQSLLSRTKGTVTTYVMAMSEIEKEARQFYEDYPIDLDIRDFVMMMVIDGCFIVELFTQFHRKLCQQNNIKQPGQDAVEGADAVQDAVQGADEGADAVQDAVQGADAVDVILGRGWLIRSIQRDLLLCENQMPYLVLSKLFKMLKGHEENIPHYFAMVFFSVSLEGKGLNWLSIFKNRPGTDPDHLLGMIYSYWCPSFAKKKHNDEFPNMPEKWIFKFSATELQEAGVKFMNKSFKGTDLVDTNSRGLESMTTPFEIEFNNGNLEIPRLTIDQNTESLFRNLLAYEQQSQSFPFSYITDYIRFMDILIDTEKDVQILRDSEIIQNGLGDDKAVCKMFNDFCKNLVLSRDSCYSEVLTRMHDHRSKRLHRWMANLRHNYFNSPWALISFFAAAFVILLTAAQTLYAVLSYHNI